MAEKQKDPNTIRLTNVRLSFPHLFKPKAFEEGKEPSFSASFILDKEKDAAQISKLKELLRRVMTEKWQGKVTAAALKGMCLNDGAAKPEIEGYGDGIMYVSASSQKRSGFVVVDRNPNVPLTEADGRPYAGCYVNALIRVWAQDNKWGKRLNAQIKGVQFVRDGEAFGEAPVNATEAFDNEEGEDVGGDSSDADSIL